MPVGRNLRKLGCAPPCIRGAILAEQASISRTLLLPRKSRSERILRGRRRRFEVVFERVGLAHDRQSHPAGAARCRSTRNWIWVKHTSLRFAGGELILGCFVAGTIIPICSEIGRLYGQSDGSSQAAGALAVPQRPQGRRR